MEPRPSRVAPDEREVSDGVQTAAIVREQAFATADRWVGYVRTEPGEWSGWHHHGDTDSYFYVIRGQLEFEVGSDGSGLKVRPGDFAHMPPQTIHRERTAPGEGGEVILVRIGPGPTVVNVEGPSG